MKVKQVTESDDEIIPKETSDGDKKFFESKEAWKEYYLENKEAIDATATCDLNKKYKVKDHLFRRMYNVITFKKDIPYIRRSDTINKRLQVIEETVNSLIEIMNDVQEKLEMV